VVGSVCLYGGSLKRCDGSVKRFSGYVERCGVSVIKMW
jgi:hypothetical protein